MGLLDFLLFDDDKNNNDNNDKELEGLGLEDWQKEEIKKGNYDPWSFDEEEMDEDDYYYEDDDK